VDFIQLREKDLPAGELEAIARDAVRVVRDSGTRTRLLINSRTDVAIASLADGVHLRSEDISPEEVRSVYRSSHQLQPLSDPVIGVSCHNDEEVKRAANAAASFAVFGPVFAKQGTRPAGLEELSRVCSYGIPLLALGGVTLGNFQDCLSVGAAGIAGIRLFQESDLGHTVPNLRNFNG
jgi:thiamine-phosphate pyrophosphorylase